MRLEIHSWLTFHLYINAISIDNNERANPLEYSLFSVPISEILMKPLCDCQRKSTLIKMLCLLDYRKIFRYCKMIVYRGGSRGGGVLGVRTPPPPPFGGPPNFIKKGKMARACARKLRILVLNSYPDPPLSEILYPPLV